MKIIKKMSKSTYKGADGNERHYYNYYLQLDNGKRITIKCAYKDDYRLLDFVSEFVK